MTNGKSDFPEIVIDDADSEPSFSRAIRSAVRRFDFKQLPNYQQMIYRCMRVHGEREALDRFRQAMASVRSESPDNFFAKHGDNLWLLSAGEQILGNMTKGERSRFFPFHDFRVLPRGQTLHVQCVSLQKTRTSRDTIAYYSKRRPTIFVEGTEYILAWSREAIIQTMWRLLNMGHEAVLKPDRISHTIESMLRAGDAYAGLGDVNGFFELCQHFEHCKLRGGGENSASLVDAATFFDQCSNPQFWAYRYVQELGGADYDPANGTPYYRVGYCPLALDGEFAVATTFLPPGFAKTPENEKIKCLPRLKAIAQDDKAPVRLTEHADFAALRHFHSHGHPQLVQSHAQWFATYDGRAPWLGRMG